MPQDDSKWLLARLQEIAVESPPVPPVVLEVGSDEPADAELTPIAPDADSASDARRGDAATERGSERAHTRIQWKLAKLGQDLGLRVWVASNDKSTTYDGKRLGDMSIDELPVTFDRTTQGTIERIDLLWLQRNGIVAAFEIESTTAIYSGLLRMSDLLAMQPNLNIALYLVAPDERQRATFIERYVDRRSLDSSVPCTTYAATSPFSKLEEDTRAVRGWDSVYATGLHRVHRRIGRVESAAATGWACGHSCRTPQPRSARTRQ